MTVPGVRTTPWESMTEILTESFCERCGTRYTFESKAGRPGKRRGIRTLSAGLRNFVLSDDTSLSDAMAAARSEQERAVTNHQLDAFHNAFNFCMSCRQYTCATCWNETEGRCLTCSPHLGHEVLPAPFPTLEVEAPAPEVERPRISAEAWPALDLSTPTPEGIEPEPTSEPVPAEAVSADDDAETRVAQGEPHRAPDPTAAEVAETATSRTRSLLGRFRPGQIIDAEIAAFEREVVAEPEAVPEAEPLLAEAEPEVVAEAVAIVAEAEAQLELEVVAEAVAIVAEAEAQLELEAEAEAQLEAEPEHVVAQAEAEPEVESVVAEEPAAAELESRTDVVEQPVWRIVAPDEPGASPAPTNERPAVPAAGGEPQWPAAPSDRLDFMRLPRHADDVWAASSKDLFAPAPTPIPGAAPVTIQSCSACGLSLSATARFCRRCGTRQG